MSTNNLTAKQLLDLRSLVEQSSSTASGGSAGGDEEETGRRIRQILGDRADYEEALVAAFAAKALSRSEFLFLLSA